MLNLHVGGISIYRNLGHMTSYAFQICRVLTFNDSGLQKLRLFPSCCMTRTVGTS
jgi:hypothetical protein